MGTTWKSSWPINSLLLCLDWSYRVPRGGFPILSRLGLPGSNRWKSARHHSKNGGWTSWKMIDKPPLKSWWNLETNRTKKPRPSRESIIGDFFLARLQMATQRNQWATFSYPNAWQFYWKNPLIFNRNYLPETNSLPWKIDRNPKGNDGLPTIHFQGASC